MIKKALITTGILLIGLGLFLNSRQRSAEKKQEPHSFNVKSVDTMKFSRDLAREKKDSKAFENEIDRQVSQIADTGVTHVAIATPYDEEFVPYLEKWIAAARRYNLNVWFRGNFSGWENWFDYPSISQEEHTKKTVRFINEHDDLFMDGDIFVSCPECENGGPGDPRKTRDIEGFRHFLIDEKQEVDSAFNKQGKSIETGYYSMNGDVAKLIMDPLTTNALGGIVTVDHYVSSPEQFVKDIRYLHEISGGNIVIGEMGAPIPDIHGTMSEDQQAAWINSALTQLSKESYVIGVNYWTDKGSSTALWNKDDSKRKAVEIIEKFYKQ